MGREPTLHAVDGRQLEFAAIRVALARLASIEASDDRGTSGARGSAGYSVLRQELISLKNLVALVEERAQRTSRFYMVFTVTAVALGVVAHFAGLYADAPSEQLRMLIPIFLGLLAAFPYRSYLKNHDERRVLHFLRNALENRLQIIDEKARLEKPIGEVSPS